MMKDVIQRSENDKDKNKLAKLTAQFIRSFCRNNVLDLKNYEDDLAEFIDSFLHIEEAVALKKMLQGQKE
jgi:hypothetical protein